MMMSIANPKKPEGKRTDALRSAKKLEKPGFCAPIIKEFGKVYTLPT